MITMNSQPNMIENTKDLITCTYIMMLSKSVPYIEFWSNWCVFSFPWVYTDEARLLQIAVQSTEQGWDRNVCHKTTIWRASYV